MVLRLNQLIALGKYERLPTTSIPVREYGKLPATKSSLIEPSVHSLPAAGVKQNKSAPVCLDDLSDEALDVLEASHPVAANFGIFCTPWPIAYLWGDKRGLAPHFAWFYHNRAGPEHSCAFSAYLHSQSEEAT